MKKIIILLIIIIVGCEKDDFCTAEDMGSKLILKFKNTSNQHDIPKDSLTVWAMNKDTLYHKIVSDSIAIPLNPVKNTTTYNFSISKDEISKLTISYQTKDEFVSRSCGYRILFENLNISKVKMPKSWINSISKTNISSIKNQKNAHLTIYY